MTSQRFVVWYTGADPPGWASGRATENGIDLVPLGDGDAPARVAELRPRGYVMNDPDYGPRCRSFPGGRPMPATEAGKPAWRAKEGREVPHQLE